MNNEWLALIIHNSSLIFGLNTLIKRAFQERKGAETSPAMP
jgi:hypothetical protein